MTACARPNCNQPAHPLASEMMPPPPPPIPVRSQTHCTQCGRQMVDTIEKDGYDRDGTPKTMRWRTCPRFWPSWRNLWMGAYHDSFSLDVPLLGREYR